MSEAHGDGIASLIAAAAGGDSGAVQQLLHRLHDRLIAFVDARIGVAYRGRIVAEDILQDAYITTCKRLPEFQGRSEAQLFSWISQIAENRLMDATRKLRTQKRGGGRVALAADIAPSGEEDVVQVLEALAAHTRTPSRSVAAIEAAQKVNTVLATLKDDYQTVLRLRFMDGLSVKEVAGRIKRSEGATQMLLARAIEALRNALGDPTWYTTRLGSS